MSDFTEELRVSKEILTRVVDVYRKLRNTCRILVGESLRLRPGDRHGAARASSMRSIALRWPDTPKPRSGCCARTTTYDFSTVSQTLNTLATVDLSAFYVDVTKDRMYTFARAVARAASTQTAMYLMCDGLARLLAPILPVTADDLWRHMPGHASASVHLEEFPKVEHLHGDRDMRRRLGPAARRARDGERGARGEAEGQDHRHLARRAASMLTASGRSPRCSSSTATHLPMLFIVSDRGRCNLGATRRAPTRCASMSARRAA